MAAQAFLDLDACHVDDLAPEGQRKRKARRLLFEGDTATGGAAGFLGQFRWA